jgi:hypothetical protein
MVRKIKLGIKEIPVLTNLDLGFDADLSAGVVAGATDLRPLFTTGVVTAAFGDFFPAGVVTIGVVGSSSSTFSTSLTFFLLGFVAAATVSSLGLFLSEADWVFVVDLFFGGGEGSGTVSVLRFGGIL